MKKNNNVALDYWNEFAKKKGLEITMDTGRRAEWTSIRTIFNITPETCPHIIELGCGAGHFVINFLKQGFKVTGVDVAKDCLKVCQKRAEHYDLEKNLNLVLFDFKRPKFKNEFDAGYLISTFHCLSNNLKEQEIIFRNFLDTIRKGGVVFIMEPNPYNILYYLAYPFLYKKNWREGYNIVHSSSKRLKKLLELFGVRNIKTYPYGFLPTGFTTKLKLIKKFNEILCKIPFLRKFSLFNLFLGIKK